MKSKVSHSHEIDPEMMLILELPKLLKQLGITLLYLLKIKRKK